MKKISELYGKWEEKTFHCDRHGEYRKRVVVRGKAEMFSECPECLAEKELTAQKIENAENFERQWREFGAGDRYKNATLQSWRPSNETQELVLRFCEQFADSFEAGVGNGMLLLGAAGTGKTHLAIGTSESLMRRGFSAKYYTLSMLLSGVRSCYGRGALQTEDEFYNALLSYDLLVIDEIAVKSISADEFNTLYRIIDDRYRWMKSTLLCANATKKDAESFLTERITDRLRETFVTVTLNWESYRSKKPLVTRREKIASSEYVG